MTDDKLVEALRATRDELKALLDGETCDHDANICWCGTLGVLENADEVLADHAAESAQAQDKWHMPGIGEVHNSDHTLTLYCCKLDSEGEDCADDALAQRVCDALNAAPQPAFWQVRYTDEGGMEFYPWEGTYTKDQAERLVDAHRQQDRAAQMRPLYAGQPAQVDIDKAVDRFLAWKLPDDFSPDCFVRFSVQHATANGSWPIGTNLLTAEQAKAMLEHVLQGQLPAQRKPVMAANPLSPTGAQQPIQSVLRALASQEGCDGAPWDQMVQAADRIDELEQPQPQVDVDALWELINKSEVEINELATPEGSLVGAASYIIRKRDLDALLPK